MKNNQKREIGQQRRRKALQRVRTLSTARGVSGQSPAAGPA
jgi:hypothetical protein